jgi:hypothetical protein
MTKRTVVACLIAACVAAVPSRASARGLDDIWDILDALSGPGPFIGAPVLAATIACWEDGAAMVTRAMSNPDKLDPCLYVDFRDMYVEPKGPYGTVTAKLVETGLSFGQFPSLDIGAGFGVAFFATTVGGRDFNVTNFTVTPVRVAFKPLRLIRRWRDDPRAGFLQVHYRGTVRFGEIDGSDFGAPADTFRAGTEFLNGASLVFDVLQALKGR